MDKKSKNISATLINLQIKNNTNSYVQLNFLGNNANLADVSNQKTRYQYDLTGVTIAGNNLITITVQTKGSSQLFTYTAPFYGNNTQAVVTGLNTIGIATFWVNGSNPNIIETYNDNIILNTLSLTGAGATVSNLEVYILTTLSGGANTIVTQNATQIVNLPNPQPYDANFGILGGDVIALSGQFPVGTVSGVARVINVTTSTTIYTTPAVSGGLFSYSFTVTSGNNYQITILAS